MDSMATLAWVRTEIEPLATSLQPALVDVAVPLCEFLRDGRALVLLTAALPRADSESNQPQDVTALPKHLQRSLHQTTTFHALERIQFFIKWCRADAALDAFVVFSSVQLLDEQNDKVVAACLDALRSKFRPELQGIAAPIAVTTTPVAAAVVSAAVAPLAPSTPSKISGLWVKRASAHQLLASPASSRNNSDSSNQSSHDVSPPVSSLNSRLNAFLNKFPSESNVLTTAAVIPSAVAVVDAQPQDTDDDDDNNAEEEAVETYNEDEDDEEVATKPQEPLARFADALSPRSESSRSSMSFSFTSEPRHHESFPDDAQTNESSPPASPKPAPRLRIPSIFERNVATASEGAAPVATESSNSAPTKDETPRAVSKLSIPAAFARSTSQSSTSAQAVVAQVESEVVTVATTTVVESVEAVAKPVSKLSIPNAFSSSSSSTVSIESTAASDAAVEEAAAVAPKAVSKLSIPAAFSRSTSTSSSNTSDRVSFTKSTPAAVVAQDVSTVASPQPALAKKPSRLKIPSAFSSGSATAAAPVEEAVAVQEEPTVRSPLAAFVASPSASLNASSSSSVSSPSFKPLASKLAAFLSTVEVVSSPVKPSSDNAVVATVADQQERFSDDESVNADTDPAFSEEIAFNDMRFSVSQETAIGLPDDADAVPSFERLSLSSEPSAANEVDLEGHEEEHAIDHHDHTDSEQPFFVVEEVSMTRPATSSKLYAFLSVVDGTESPRFSHISSTGEDKTLEEAAALAAARLSGGSHKSGGSHSPSNSVTSQPLVSASSDVILEKERLSGENLALQLKLRTAETQLSAKTVESASLRANIVTLQAQLAAAANPSDFRLRAAAEASKTQVTEAKSAHVKTIKAAQAAREQFLSEKKLLEDKLRTIKTQSASAQAVLSAQLAEAKKAHLKTVTSAQATREQLSSETKLLRALTQQSQSAASALSLRLTEANKAHVKTIRTAQFSREHFASENVQLTTLASQKQSAAAAFKNQVAELKKAHLKTIKTAQFSREQLLTSGSKFVGATSVIESANVVSQQESSRLAALVQQSKTLEQKLQDAKDSEEAARNSVQATLVELIRSQQATISELSQRVG